MNDLVVTCRDCHTRFIVSEAELKALQERARVKNWEYCEPPKRCKACRTDRRTALATTTGFDVLNEDDARRAWREGYLTIYSGTIAIQEDNEVKFVRFIVEMLRKGEAVRAVTKLRTAERQTANRETANRVW